MPTTFPAYWTVRLNARAAQIPLIEEAVIDEAQAITTLESPDEGMSVLELLYDYAPDEAALKAQLGAVLGDGAVPALEIKSLGSLDWIKEVAQEFPPLPIGRWTIHGAAFRDKVGTHTLPLQIDSTSAFGTGEHPTTRGCLLMLDALLDRFPRLRSPKARMLDVGCGSGILAMAYSMATGAQALGIDMEEESIAIARENIAVNKLESLVSVETGMGYAPANVAARAPYDLIMANIFADPLCELAKDMKLHLAEDGVAILSGILNHQAGAVIQAHKHQGIKLLKRMRLGAWSVLALRKA